MNAHSFSILAAAILLLGGTACVKMDDIPSPGKPGGSPAGKKLSFDVTVTRDGKAIPTGAITKGGVDSGDKIATMDQDIPFGLIGLDAESGELLIDNASVHNRGTGYSAMFDNSLWQMPARVRFSAYYPHVDRLTYESDNSGYSIPFSANETEAGPLVSKTVEKAIDQLNMVPLEFQHITNDIGYKICDVTPDPQLQGLIHLRKVTATNVASAGVFLNDLEGGRGLWHRQAYYRSVVVFEGDAVVGVGSSNEKFIGYDTLVDRMADSHRYYSIPDDIEIGKQCVEVIYDVDGFKIENFEYAPLKNQTAKYMLYGLLPDNVFVYGKQYTFHLGLDVSKLYKQISFSASVSDWETKIYENNDDF